MRLAGKPVRFRCPSCQHPAATGAHPRCVKRTMKRLAKLATQVGDINEKQTGRRDVPLTTVIA